MLSRKGLTAEVNSALPFLGTNSFLIFTKFYVPGRRKIFVTLGSRLPLAMILCALLLYNHGNSPTVSLLAQQIGLRFTAELNSALRP